MSSFKHLATHRALGLLTGLLLLSLPAAQQPTGAGAAQSPGFNVKANYSKTEYQIPMRDGVKLLTVVYTPKDASQKYPIMLTRTPYSSGPYGADAYKSVLGPSPLFAPEGFIFVYQDVRGTFLSEGEFEDMRPYLPKKKAAREVDESSDAYDTIEWLLKNVPNHNGRVGLYGTSYPGFYAAMGLVDAHPALKAVSPQAPIADLFLGDDDHHNGAFFEFDTFEFSQFFGLPRPQPTANQFRNFDLGTPDAYQFFLGLGPVANMNKLYFKGGNKYINDVFEHGTYDAFWEARATPQHFKNVKPAVLVVGGWFDAEDLYGPLHTYEAIERNNPQTANLLVMGPWCHGCWHTPGDSLGDISFGAKTGEWFSANVELPFFNFHLKDKGELKLPEAYAFRTGTNEWKAYEQWPPKEAREQSLYLRGGGRLSFEAPKSGDAPFDEYASDPNKPVAYTNAVSNDRGTTYMTEDQRFAARRPDVLVYESEALGEDLTLAGPISANLFVATTGTDADFVVKVIDVYPNDAPNNSPLGQEIKMGGYQMLVRGEVMRAKFRRSFSRPEPLTPGKPAQVAFNLNDVHHTFLKGHKMMVQVQSTWFPLVDRNPQKFVDIYRATESDFQAATHRIYHSAQMASHLKVRVLK